MCTTAFSSALAISVFAADDREIPPSHPLFHEWSLTCSFFAVYYDLDLNWGVAIFTLISSQFLGYGLVSFYCHPVGHKRF